MKQTLILATVLLLSFTTIENPIDRIGVKGPLTFDKRDFKLAWTAKPNEKYYVQEYLPDGERLETFNQMLTINLFETDIHIVQAVNQKTRELDKRKQTDPVCNYTVTESPDAKEYIVDFLLGESKDDQMTVIEFNINRYKQVDLGNGRKGILIYVYSKRAYSEAITPFLESLKDNRIKHLNEMIATEMPSVKI